jgi:hypothetical protein
MFEYLSQDMRCWTFKYFDNYLIIFLRAFKLMKQHKDTFNKSFLLGSLHCHSPLPNFQLPRVALNSSSLSNQNPILPNPFELLVCWWLNVHCTLYSLVLSGFRNPLVLHDEIAALPNIRPTSSCVESNSCYYWRADRGNWKAESGNTSSCQQKGGIDKHLEWLLRNFKAQ